MANRPGILRANLGCIVRIAVALVVLGVLGCMGTCTGVYTAFFTGIYTPPPPVDRPVVIRGGTVWDGTEDAPRSGRLVLIEDGEVQCVGKDCRVPAHAEVLEVRDVFIMPGLVDLHIHLGAPTAADAGRSVPGQMWATLRHRPFMRQGLLEHGVTTVRSVGDDLQSTLNMQTWLQDGTLGGPQVLTAGPVFTAPGGHPADKLAADAPWLLAGSTREVDDANLARTRVQEVIDQGVQGVKLVFDDVDGRLPKLDPEVMRAVAADARSRNVWVAVHTGTSEDVVAAVEAGATTIEHGAREPISDEAIAAMIEHDVTLVPTLAVVDALLPSLLPTALENAKKAHEAGVKIAVGSDTQGPDMAFGTSTLREVQLLMQAGIPPVDALKAATSVGAETLQLKDIVGVLQEGAEADLVMFAGDPTTDPAALMEPVLVIQDGRVVVDRR